MATIQEFATANAVAPFTLLGTRKLHHVVNVNETGDIFAVQRVDGDWVQSMGYYFWADRFLGLFI